MPKKTVDLSQPRAQQDIRTFLDALNAGGGKPMEQMKPKEARRVLEDAQRSVEVPLREVEISEKTITWKVRIFCCSWCGRPGSKRRCRYSCSFTAAVGC